MINQTNKCCKIFEEQIKLLLSMPNQEEAKNVLYQALINSYNQFEKQNDNQIENQNENAYISISLSILSSNILNLLSKNIVWKEYSNNYGGNRENSGRKNNYLKNKTKTENVTGTLPDTVPVTLQEQIRIDKIRKDKEIYKERFEKFWIEYPRQRRGNKEKAYRAYCRVIKEGRATPEKLLEVAKDYAVSDEVKRGYAKGCEAWLNDDRFNIEYKKQEQEWMI